MNPLLPEEYGIPDAEAHAAGRTLYITAEAGEGTFAFRSAVLPGHFGIDYHRALPLPMFSDTGRGFFIYGKGVFLPGNG